MVDVDVIDVGINRVEDASKAWLRLVGDVDFEAVSDADHILQSCGVGHMTVAMLMHNTLRAFKAAAAEDGENEEPNGQRPKSVKQLGPENARLSICDSARCQNLF